MDVLAFESKIFDLGACALPNGLVMAMSLSERHAYGAAARPDRIGH